jgi:hypothetical protein
MLVFLKKKKKKCVTTRCDIVTLRPRNIVTPAGPGFEAYLRDKGLHQMSNRAMPSVAPSFATSRYARNASIVLVGMRGGKSLQYSFG